MTGEGTPVDATLYLGQRLRMWRHERDWSGQEVALALGERRGRDAEWAELQEYEVGAAFPDARTASHLAALFERPFGDLIIPTPPSGGFEASPWPPRVPTANDLEAVRGVLHERGFDPRLAERFFELGLSKASTSRWLRTFDPAAAFEWISRRFGPKEAERWAAEDHDVRTALTFKAFGLEPGQPMDPGDKVLLDLGVAPEVIITVRQLGLNRENRAREWLSDGWDLLAAVPWLLVGFDRATAYSWQDHGFNVFDALSLSATFSAEEAATWRATSIQLSAWERWHARGYAPDHADRWSSAAFDSDSAEPWRVQHFDPSDASAFRALGLDHQSAAQWRDSGLFAAQVGGWLERGLLVGDRRAWRALSADPEEVAAFKLAGLSPEVVDRWVAAGFDPSTIERWQSFNFSFDEASRWRGTSPERAHRLVLRGITPEADRQRRATGAHNLATAAEASQPARSQPTDRSRLTNAPTASRGRFLSGCPACGRPISANGTCGCS